jgi:hypothetical protein
MQVKTGEWWLDELVTAASVARAGTQTAFYRSVRAGRFRRLCHAVYIPGHVWERLTRDEQFRARVHAVARAARQGLVFSHLSAAALWRLPMVGTWPQAPEVLRDSASGGRSRPGYRAHLAAEPAVTVLLDEVRITTLATTVVDVARTAQLGTAVTMADAALAGVTPAGGSTSTFAVTRRELLDALAESPAKKGRARCANVLELADGASGSPGESVSRVGMHLQGLPAPVLQNEFRDSRGLIGYVDFWWPEFGLIGEFDGLGKYTRLDMLAGRSPAEAVIAEKVREDRLRALGPRVVRWGWDAAISPLRLGEVLRRAGLR